MKAYVSSFFYVLLYLSVSALLLVDLDKISFNTIFAGLIFAYIIGLSVGSERDLLLGAELSKYPIILFISLGPLFYFVFFIIIHPDNILQNPLLISLGASLAGIIVSKKSGIVKYGSTLVMVAVFFMYAYLGLYWK